MTDRLVVLARGLGTRMRKTDAESELSAEQAKVADSGVKALIPIDRPFLDYVLSAAVETGYRRVCLVIGPEHSELREYYTKLSSGLNPGRLSIDFAIQALPLGTANAVLAAKDWCGDAPFVVINSDNYYPPAALHQLRELPAPGVGLFEREAMLSGSNIPAERIEKFAIAELDQGCLKRVIEKPSAQIMASAARQNGGKIYLSMNLWVFDRAIFRACEAIPKSSRGEFEITDAVQYAIDKLGSSFAAALIEAPVLDLSSRADVGPVTERLRGTEVRL